VSPNFDDLIDGSDSGDALEGLRRVHDLLVSASPPPPLSGRVARPPRIGAPARRRRIVATASLAAAASVVVGVLAGYTIGHRTGFDTAYALTMHGVGAGRDATALIDVGTQDPAGNRPLEMTVRGLPPLAKGGWYELYLTYKGKTVLPCGTFQTGAASSAQVIMNMPGTLSEHTGWIVTTRQPGKPRRVFLTT